MRATLLRLLGLPLALCLLVAPSAFAETSVQAVVCTGDSQPTLSLLPDINDSTLRVNRVEITGLVERVSAVEVYVDGEYDHTIAIPANETTFSTSVRLPIGTHSLHIEAIGICTSNNATKDAVVTIIPWNSGFARPTGNTPTQTTPDDTYNMESSDETLDQVVASNFTQEQASGILGFLQAVFPAASPEDAILTSVFIAAATLPLLPSGVLTQAAIGQFIAGRRTLFLAFIPFMGLLCMAISS